MGREVEGREGNMIWYWVEGKGLKP
ncbi:rCG55577 [Rattus norvegicus]|uniref:RCG55577 n=1 Tax=Rattus norvegicus TaxID=10116 RepID=A6JR52_RAT|nr:rCG55577 [Rattus norvegicus]